MVFYQKPFFVCNGNMRQVGVYFVIVAIMTLLFVMESLAQETYRLDGVEVTKGQFEQISSLTSTNKSFQQQPGKDLFVLQLYASEQLNFNTDRLKPCLIDTFDRRYFPIDIESRKYKVGKKQQYEIRFVFETPTHSGLKAFEMGTISFLLTNHPQIAAKIEDKEKLSKIKTIQIVVEQQYDEASGVQLPFYREAKQSLETIGFTVVDVETKQFDATLFIKASGRAIGENYSIAQGFRGEISYSGAVVSVDLLFKTSDSLLFQTVGSPFIGKQEPPKKIFKINEKPINAPWNLAFDSLSLSLTLFEMVDEVWGYDKTIETRIKTLKENLQSSYNRSKAAEALGKMKDKRATESLITILEDRSEKVRKEAAKALGEIRDVVAVEPLMNLLKDKDDEVVIEAARALGKIQNPQVIESLGVLLLENKIGRVTYANLGCVLAEALGMIKDKRATNYLLTIVQDKQINYFLEIQIESIKAIGIIKDAQAIEPLIALLKSNNKQLKVAAATALKEITGQQFGEDQGKWQKWWETNKRLQP